MSGRRLGIALVWVVALGVCSLAPAKLGHADGLGVFPTTLEFDDSLRGREYYQDVGIIHDFADQRTYRLEAAGDTNAWMSFSDGIDGPAITELVVPPRTRALFVIRINVPAEASNGDYTGLVRVVSTGAESEGSGSGSGVNVGVELPVTISVTGTQNLTGGIADLSVPTVEVGMPLRIETRIDNTGNVGFIPELEVQVVDTEAVVVGETQSSGQAIPAGKTETVTVEWDTARQKPGDYKAIVRGTADTLDLGTKEIAFRLVPFGSLTRSGDLEALELVEAAKPGGLAKFSATFRNTGQIDANSKFVGELYRDGELVAQVQSNELFIRTGGVEKLEAIVQIPSGGSYTLRGKVTYESNETAPREVSFQVAEPGGDSQQGLWLAGGGGGIALALALGGVVLFRRKSRVPGAAARLPEGA